MLKTVLAGALASGALLGGSAQAHGGGYGGYAGGCGGCGYDAGTPAYAAVGYGGGYGSTGGGYAGGGGGYAPYRPHGFTLLGARAGVTVLGIDVDGSAKLTVGAHGWGGGHARQAYAPPPQETDYAPPPMVYAPEPPMAYAPEPQPMYAPPPQPMYAPPPQPMYVQPSWGMSYSYGGYGCGC